MKFKKGDKVRIVRPHTGKQHGNTLKADFANKVGVINRVVGGSYGYTLDIDTLFYWFDDELAPFREPYQLPDELFEV